MPLCKIRHAHPRCIANDAPHHAMILGEVPLYIRSGDRYFFETLADPI